jgi:hypothetical protein
LNQRFYKRHDEMELRFYQMPKALFGNPIYKGLSLAAKAMYSILRDRMELSIQNDWYDEEGNIFSIYTVDEMAELIEIDRKTVIKYKKELVSYGLLVDKRMGFNKPNRLYVLKPETTQTDTYKPKTIDITRKSKISTSGSPKNTLPEVEIFHSNDTDFSDTDLLIDCGEILAGSESEVPSNPIANILKEKSGWMMIGDGDGRCLKKEPHFIAAIYVMLLKQFQNQLERSVVETACDFFIERTYDWTNRKMRINLQNPIGFFNTCYKDAIKEYQAHKRLKVFMNV